MRRLQLQRIGALHPILEIREGGLVTFLRRLVFGNGRDAVGAVNVHDLGQLAAVDFQFAALSVQRIRHRVFHESLQGDVAAVVALGARHLVDTVLQELPKRDATLLRLAIGEAQLGPVLSRDGEQLLEVGIHHIFRRSATRAYRTRAHLLCEAAFLDDRGSLNLIGEDLFLGDLQLVGIETETLGQGAIDLVIASGLEQGGDHVGAIGQCFAVRGMAEVGRVLPLHDHGQHDVGILGRRV